ncbi:MAG: helix-turn-helix transcriptional regulator [Cytophagales bacterium]|nr:helix-turn-helix transcriptional regulator [Cytophagales bacterium]
MKPCYIKVTPPSTHSFVVKQDDIPAKNPWHYHPELELIFFYQGRGTYFIGDCIDRITECDLVLIGSNLPHTSQRDPLYYAAHPDQKPRIMVIQFLNHFLGEGFFKLPEFSHIQDLFNRAARGVKFSGETSRQLSGRIIGLDRLNNTQRVLVLLDILDTLALSNAYVYLSSPRFSNAYAEGDAVKINKVYEYTINNFRHRISLEEVASVTNLSAAAFCRYFKSHTRKTYSRFLAEVRIGYACKLLAEGAPDIAAVCYQSGYNNFSNFNRQFKTIMKATPSEYARRRNTVIESA